MIATHPDHSSDFVDGIEYPSEDGAPMAETPIHAVAMILLFQALQDFYRDRTDVYIGIDMFWYWKKGDPKACHAPDVFVVPGVGRRGPRSFRSWEDNGAVPAVAFEMASKKTWRASLGKVKNNYEAQGVKEYFIFDPTREYLKAPIVAFRLGADGRYQQLEADAADGSVVSTELHLRLVPEGEILRMVDLATGQPIPTRDELAEQERRRAEVERQEKTALAAEVERLKALLALQQGKNGSSQPPVQ
jgi:Uma2 family endonuclease